MKLFKTYCRQSKKEKHENTYTREIEGFRKK